MLRVLAVCAVNGHGGPIQTMVTVIRNLEHDVEVMTATQLRGPSEPSPIEVASSSTVHIPRPRGLGVLRAQLAIFRSMWARRRDVDVIHANGLTEAVVALPFAIAARLDVVVWVHNSLRPDPFRLAEPVIRLSSRHWRWLAVSELAADLVPWAECEIVGNPVSPDVVPEQRIDSQRVRILYLAGSDRPNKGFDLLPEMIERLGRSDVEWHIYTSSPYKDPDPRSRKAWDRLTSPIGPNVSVRGRVSDVSTAFADADILIAPSRRESFNRTVAEAIVNGIPFLASDIQPHRGLAERSGGGLLFDVDDLPSFASQLRRLVDDATLREELGRNSIQNRGFLTPENVTDRVSETWRAATRRTLAD